MRMTPGRKLRGKHIAVLAADGFEKVELTVPVLALRAQGAQVDILSLRRGRIRGVNLHEPSGRVSVDGLIAEASPWAYDALLLPGGLISPDILRQSKEAREFVQEFDRSGRPVASICHGPWLLVSAGLVEGRVMSGWPGIRDDLVHAGAIWRDEPVVIDRNWLTSRGPQDLLPFVRALVDHFAAEPSTLHQRSGMEQSSPQRDEPPGAMLTAMKWMPRPSLRALVGLGSVVAGMLLLPRKAVAPEAGKKAAA